MNEKIIDMGAGLERFTWLTQGTPTAYEAVFGPGVDKVLNKCNIVYEKDFFLDYSKISGVLNLDEAKDINVVRTAVAKQLNITKSDLITKITPLEWK